MRIPLPNGGWTVLFFSGWLLLTGAANSSLRADETERPPTDAEVEFFERSVRPVLVNNCFRCHSAAEKQRGGLRVDSRQHLLTGGDTGAALVPGKPEESRLIRAIRYDDPDLRMPPKGKLADEEIKALTRWIEMGAPWPNSQPTASTTQPAEGDIWTRTIHWSFQPIRVTEPPRVRQVAWPRSAVDQFILAKLEAAGLTPAVPAEKPALLRRITFDLTGLPPTRAELDAFLKDNSPHAFEKVVDRLLESPHFGERWARHWLDLMRYAETLGHEFDYPLHHAWQYRNYVIRAFNADVPYDQFVTEHLAGDLLENPRRHPVEGFNESIIGTGFWYLGEDKHAPVDVRAEEAARMDNQIDVFSKTFLGLTVACARCHDHKFDPISAADYYALAGFLRSSVRQEVPLDPHGKIAAAADELAALRASGTETLSAALSGVSAGLPERIVARLLSGDLKWPELDPEQKKKAEWSDPLFFLHELNLADSDKADEFASRRDALRKRYQQQHERAESFFENTTLFADFDGGDFGGWFTVGKAFGERPTQPGDWDSRSAGARLIAPGVAHSGLLANRLTGVLRSPSFTITQPNILYRVAGKNAEVRLIIDGYRMNIFNALLFGGIAFKVNSDEFIWHRQAGDVSKFIGHRAYIEVVDDGDGWVAIDEVRFADLGPAPPERPSAPIREMLQQEDLDSPAALARAVGKVMADQLRRLQEGSLNAEGATLLNRVLDLGLLAPSDSAGGLAAISEQMRSRGEQVPEPMRVVAIGEGTPDDEHVFIRGNHKTPGELVHRRMLQAISGADQPRIENGSGRLELARRILDPGNPFPSRVMVNRVWQHLFGEGLVPSVDNFGVLGQEPTHPELLDYLADEFRNDGWSIKRLIRRLVLSRAYQMASTPGGRGDELDPQNWLLHRARIRRLEGEAIRDSMLLISGRLDRAQEGSSVPIYLTPFMQGRGRPQGGPLDGNGRRSIYIAIHRNFLSPMMLAFDTPIPFTAIGRRNVSNVPAQALILLNDPFVVQQAQLWAKRRLAESSQSPEERIRELYLDAFARPPSADEVAAGIAFLQQQANEYKLPGDRWEQDERVWTDFCHVLFNVKEFIFLQ